MADEAVTQMRHCTKCGAAKPATTEFFSPIKARRTLNSWCKPCMAQWRREDRIANPSRYRSIEKGRKNVDKRRDSNRHWYARNREAVIERRKAIRADSRDAENQRRRERHASDPARNAIRAAHYKKWYEKNREAVRGRNRLAWASAPLSKRLRNHIGAAIWHCLKSGGKGGKSWTEIVGYTADELMRHLERQFVGSMSWSNYGKWHIDHIVPIASFNIQGPSCPQLRAAWALTNLRPLWAKKNQRKSGKRLHLL